MLYRFVGRKRKESVNNEQVDFLNFLVEKERNQSTTKELAS